ncbi:MAG: glycoside hydrolase [Bacteroidales bacterium]|nr:glycoside hydrolase [Bacteroidales bacterium]
MKRIPKISLVFILMTFTLCHNLLAVPINKKDTLSLNGDWQMGFSRNYTKNVQVPGIHNDPTVMSDHVLWYKKEIKLPNGKWKSATLELKGARFQPEVYINGELVGKQQGGMGPLFYELDNRHIKPGNKIMLEIALASLKNVPESDASYIPVADHWRSNISSSLWDDVVLHLHGEISINRIIPFIDYKNQTVDVQFDLNSPEDYKGKATLDIIDVNGNVLINDNQQVSGSHNAINFNIDNKLKSWSPDNPNLYYLKLTVSDRKNKIQDQSTISFGVKSFEIINKQFYLNGQPFVAKGSTVVWPRWMRTKEGRELGYDTEWFTKNIIQRTKDLGGNYLRFHLGLPPERFLDLCDRHGLAVQYEWSFFHGMPASKESLMEQYKNWLDLAMRHPSVCLIHPYNETEGEQLKTAWAALDELLLNYPPLVLEERDVIHIHKYWWSLFENLGLYYDDADAFPKAIMVDEFGGNYLDENGDFGEYRTVKETFLRFLGRTHDADERLAFQTEANVKVAEYWRRIGAAGISPFCALGSREDGSTWFLGSLIEGNPKPVWDALAVAFSPQSVSIELWDRNFVPGQKLNLPVYLFNDESDDAVFSVKLTIENKEANVFFTKEFSSDLMALSKKIEHINVTMPPTIGDYIIKAELINKPESVKYPVISAWNFRVFKAIVPENIKNIKLAVPENESELKHFLSNMNIATTNLSDNSADAVITSLKSWNNLAMGDSTLSEKLQNSILQGKSVVMLDVGDRQLGQGYPKNDGDLGPLQGVSRVSNPQVNTYSLFSGIALKFTESAEPESHIHPDKSNSELWNYIPDEYTRLWNGYRGGLIVPAADMEFSGLSEKAFISQWMSRGANEENIKRGSCYAYELQGVFEFSDKANDMVVQKKLKDKINFLVQDAPALAIAINPNTPIEITDLNKGYIDAQKGIANNFIALSNCGKNLTKTPVAMVEFGQGKGKLLVSQLLTSGRLGKDFGDDGLYGVRYDELAAQFVLNMISLSLEK